MICLRRPLSGPIRQSAHLMNGPVFIPRFALSLNAALAILLILSVGILYHRNRQISSLRTALNREQKRTRTLPDRTEIIRPVYIVSAEASEPVIRRQLKLFRTVKEMFPQTIRWVVSSNGQIELGLTSRETWKETVGDEESPVFLWFNILRHGQIDEVVSSPVIMVYSGHEVNVKLDSLSKAEKTLYRYQCLPELRPDGKINLLVRVALNGTVLKTSVSVSEGERVKLGRLRTKDAVYSIYVTIRVQDLNMSKLENQQI